MSMSLHVTGRSWSMSMEANVKVRETEFLIGRNPEKNYHLVI